MNRTEDILISLSKKIVDFHTFHEKMEHNYPPVKRVS